MLKQGNNVRIALVSCARRVSHRNAIAVVIVGLGVVVGGCGSTSSISAARACAAQAVTLSAAITTAMAFL